MPDFASDITWGYGGTKMRFFLTGVLLALIGWPRVHSVPNAQPAGAAPESALYFFFTPDGPGGASAARHASQFVKESKGRVRLRPVVLVSEFKGIGKLQESSPFYQTLRELQSLGKLDIPLYDEEGLALAETWEIRSVPAFVLVSRGRAHRALGPRANLEELLECKS
jgi:hypothetical protein